MIGNDCSLSVPIVSSKLVRKIMAVSDPYLILTKKTDATEFSLDSTEPTKIIVDISKLTIKEQYDLSKEIAQQRDIIVERRINLSKKNYQVGRDPGCDIFLDGNLVSREHCQFTKDASRWYVIDQHSTNGTFLRRGDDNTKLTPEEEVALKHNHVICILDWELKFRDPYCTVIPSSEPPPASISVSFVYKIAPTYTMASSGPCGDLYVQKGDKVNPIARRPRRQLNRILAYMASRNKECNSPVCCSMEELKKAVWPDDEKPGLRPDNDIHGLVRELRWDIFNLEVPDKEVTELLKNRPGEGYILNINWS